jgi:arginyl-tRNA synthetase
MMGSYARGKYAQAISDRSGQAFPYREMVKEWNGSFVHKSEYEAKHPQIRRKHITADAIALANARPQRSSPTIVDLNPALLFNSNPASLVPPLTPDQQNSKRQLRVRTASSATSTVPSAGSITVILR